MIGRMNYDLANQFGNLAQRVLSMIAKNCDGKVPQPGALSGDDEALLGAAGALLAEVRAEMDRSEEHTSELQSLMRISYAVFCLKKKKKETSTQTTKE